MRTTHCVYCGYEQEMSPDPCGWCQRERRSFVYFMEQRDGYAIKIGYTGQGAFSRMRNLSTGNPHGIRLLGFVEGWGKEQESFLHNAFEDLRLEGEWFRATSDLHEYIRGLERSGLLERPATYRPEPVPVPLSDPWPFQVGARVRHETFGVGTVVERIFGLAGHDDEAVVDFDNHGRKQLLLAYAPMTAAAPF